jgi:hypothetical protein
MKNSANPDAEILHAVRPGLATTSGPLFMISSPYARRGELWRAFNKHYGPSGDPAILVAQGSSRTFNQTLSQSVVDRALQRDPAAAAAEYLAEFRRDIESFVSLEAVQSCIPSGQFELPPQPGTSYLGFVDPSGGSADSMTLVIAHMDHSKDTVIIDVIREVRPPFSPEIVTNEFCAVLKSYYLSSCTADKYAGAWVAEQFGKCGIVCEQAAKPKSELYGDLLAAINSRRVQLLDHSRLINQLIGLERRTGRTGKDSIDHGPGGHDDLANAVAGAVSICLIEGTYNLQALNNGFAVLAGGGSHRPKSTEQSARERDAFRKARLHNYLAAHGAFGWPP